MNENNKNVSVTDVLKFKTENDFGVETEFEVHISLIDYGKNYKAIVKAGKVENEYVFRKKDINKLSTSTNSTLFKGLSSLDTNYIVKSIQDLENDLNNAIKEEEMKIIETNEQERNGMIQRGKEFYQYCKDNNILPSNYIMAASRWKVASEETNVLRLVLSILSTMRGEPVNLIGKSSAGSGKSIVEETAFNMVNPHNYMILNFSTPAAFKNACIGNAYLFKNKTIRYGDLGSSVAEEVMEEVNSIIKQLNSEGYYKSNKMMGQEDIVEIELIGKCAMCFSKVENDKPLDVQDVSRGILWATNIHNDEAYEDFNEWVDYKSEEDVKYEEKLFSNIRDYMEYLASLDIVVFNPYKNTLNQLFKGNEAYRRLLVKQDSILKMLALVNLPNKEIIDGKRIYVSNEDFELYYKLFHKSLIALREFNVSEADIDLYNTLESYYNPINEDEAYIEFIQILNDNNKDFYDDDFKYNDSFFTVNDIINEMSNIRSVHNIIGIADNDNVKRSKIRSSLQRLENFIGKYHIPDENWKGRGLKPTLYYIKKVEKDDIVKYSIPNKTFSIINSQYGENDIKYIIDDMKSHCFNFEKKVNKLVGCIEDVNDKSILDCPVIDNPKYMDLEDIDLSKFV